jgi:Family of unknown function (DUF6165)
MILAPISIGELIDKITILQIKMQMIKDTDKLSNVSEELSQLTQVFDDNIGGNLNEDDGLTELRNRLYNVNQELWHIEDFKRACERDQNFGEEFVQAARQVYLKNDMRASIKRQINSLTGSTIVEEKSYSATQ